jgi:two-component system, OmpR family, sensor histidine kinase CpxA
MRSLFLRIFLSFWVAQALFIVLAILVTIAMTPGRQERIGNMGAQALTEAVSASQSGGEHAAGEYLEELQHKYHVWAYVYGPSGREISGRLAPPWIEDAYRTGHPHHRGWLDNFLPDRTSIQTLTLAGQRYTLVLERPPGPRMFFGPHEIPGLGISIWVVSSGLVCYALAWSMTNPVSRLRHAAQRLAAGDLSARAGAPLGRRRDELAQLMRDFDRMAEKIETLMETQSRLLKDVSHELRSPLARLSVALGLARQRATPDSESALDRIELETERLNHLIQRLLTLSRLEAATGGIPKASVDLRDLVEHIARDAEYETPARSCRVEADPDEDYAVLADPELLRSAIENIVRNATRYGAAGTPVEIHLARESAAAGDQIVVRVLDAGPGVPPEDLDRIFQPFYRIDDARNRQTGGAGLGLSIADRAVRLHGGRVRASNRAGGGLEVEIRIPAARPGAIAEGGQRSEVRLQK